MLEFIIVFVISYLWHALGVTVGYHRLLSHRSFSCPKFVEYFWVLGGYLCLEGSPIWWTTIHRAHHRFVDTPLDPHAPKFGLYNSHHGWLLHKAYPSEYSPQTLTKDLLHDPVYRFLEQGGDWHRAHTLVFTLALAVRLLIWLIFGWQAALASLLAGLVVLQLPLILNVVCHIPKLGYKNYATKDDSVNVWWIALFSMGEGWHNNHHASPGSARTGMRPWEFDLSWLTIKAMKSLKLVTWVNEKTHEQLVTRFNQESLSEANAIEKEAQLVRKKNLFEKLVQEKSVPLRSFNKETVQEKLRLVREVHKKSLHRKTVQEVRRSTRKNSHQELTHKLTPLLASARSTSVSPVPVRVYNRELARSE